MKSYFVFLERNKLYTAVTVLGFALSLAFVILVALYVRDEMTIDDHHEKIDRIYRVEYGNSPHCYTAAAMGRDLQSAYPEIESYMQHDHVIFNAVTPFNEQMELDCAVVDSSFFSIFSIPLIESSPSTVMRSTCDVVISEKMARRFFGTTHNIIGRSIKVDPYSPDLIVSSIYRAVENSALPTPDLFARFEAVMNPNHSTAGYEQSTSILILLARQGADLVSKSTDFARFLRERGHPELLAQEGGVDTVTLRPLSELYFSDIEQGFTKRGDLRFLIILIVVALSILLFAVINYINLSVAQSGFRAREMATRRLMGSTKRAIFGKFILESILLCSMSSIVALAVASLLQVSFNNLIQSSINLNAEFTALNIAAFLAFIALLGVIAGIIPAMIILKFNPIEVVRGTFTYRTKKVYSKILIITQYTITVLLIGLATLITRQTDYMQSLDLGFSTKNLYNAEHFIRTDEQANAVRSALMQVKGVESVGFAQYTQLHYPTRYVATVGGEQHFLHLFSMDSSSFSMFDFEVIAHTGNDSDTALYINETGLRKLGYTSVPDQIRSEGDWLCIGIKGVVRDFHYSSLTDPVGIAIIGSKMSWSQNVIVKSYNDSIGVAVKLALDQLSGGAPYKGNWLDEDVARWSAQVERQSDLIFWLSVMAVIISSLGMLAMATYFIRGRRSEIAVRKIFGSESGEVMSMLVWQFLRLVMVAYLLAAPLIWYFGSQWLAEFPYRIGIGVAEYLSAALVAIAVAALTVIWQAYRAATANPANSVKR